MLKNTSKKLRGIISIFCTFLISMFSVFDVKAQTVTIAIRNGQPVKDFNVIAENFILWILSVAGTLILLLLIFNLATHLFYITNRAFDKNNYYKEKLTKTQKRVRQFFKILILIFVLYVFFDNFTKLLLDFLR